MRSGLLLLLTLASGCLAREIHVATGGDAHDGSAAAPFRTIQQAAEVAQPGDVVTVHEGIYRERIDPPRGGDSEERRIVYRAAQGEHVEIRGSEVARGWVRDSGDVWRLTLPSSRFGDFNPFADEIRGDWFDPRGRVHHTGAVYLDGEWLTEAASLEELYLPAGERPAWMATSGGQYLLNVAWLGMGEAKLPASGTAERSDGVGTAACSEGGECIGWIEDGDWTRYSSVDFGPGRESLDLRVASASEGGWIELRLDGREGTLLGRGLVPPTGDWQVWKSITVPIERTSGIHELYLVYRDRLSPEERIRERGINPNLWFAELTPTETTIRAQFPGVDPNDRLVEIHARQSVFYPSRPGVNWITVRGFTMCHAATPWAPPTAEQIGCLGTNWSTGWLIEGNAVHHSTCSGIALGKHGDEFDNTSANTAEGYVATIERAHAFAIPWRKGLVGGHVVRGNTVSHCEQAGIVGSMGSAFCLVEGNEIHDVHVRRLFSGAEMAGIKFHGAVDTVIRRNRIWRTVLGLWLDWMAQGTRVSANVFSENAGQDLFLEVDHGPFVVDNNVFLSPVSLLDVSEGGAYVHNLFAGRIVQFPEPNRETPYHPAHSTEVAGLARTTGGDNRFLANIFVGEGAGLHVYNDRGFPLIAADNVYLAGASPYAAEAGALVDGEARPDLRLVEEYGAVRLEITVPPSLAARRVAPRSSAGLGEARVAGLPYEDADGSPIVFDRDCFGRESREGHRAPGPFADLREGRDRVRVW